MSLNDEAAVSARHAAAATPSLDLKLAQSASARARADLLLVLRQERAQVTGIVAGPTAAVAICNECVNLCVEILTETDPGAPKE